jgi:16S rRNA (uracil1498-N3)-methyltransferase
MSEFYCQNIQNDTIVLDEEESNHCFRVLRKKIGDVIKVIDGKGFEYEAKILDQDKKQAICTILQKKVTQIYHPNHHIVIAPTKSGDRIEWFVEKAVEIGIGGIHFIETKRTERSKINMDRIKKIVISAMKQSKNNYLPILSGMVKFKEILSFNFKGNKLIAHLNEQSININTIYPLLSQSVLMIGPEGDFTNEEVFLAKNAGFSEVSLGESVLRTETAGVFGLTVMNLMTSK